MDTEQFIKKAKLIHGNKYDYSLVEYVNNKTKIKIICNTCKDSYLQSPAEHLSGKGIRCSCNTLTEKRFLKEAKEKHCKKYNFDNIKYINSNTKIKFTCNECNNIIERTPADVLRTVNLCKVCGIPHKRKTTEQFIKKAKEKFGDKFDYSLVEYVNKDTPIKIICNECKQIMIQTPNNHLACKYGCTNVMCKNAPPTGIKYTTETFIEVAKEKFGNDFDYSFVEYKGTWTPIKIKCNKCKQIREVLPNTFLMRGGCLHNKESFGEKIIRIVLEKRNIEHKQQYIFKDCRDINPLPFDFYIPSKNLLIEFQGKQHYEPRELFGGVKGMILTQKHDQIKREYCLNNGIKEIEIPYWELRNIEKILNNNL